MKKDKFDLENDWVEKIISKKLGKYYFGMLFLDGMTSIPKNKKIKKKKVKKK